jgi:CHAD domain-containing protein
MRSGARRLRGELRLFEPLVDVEWAESLADELRWLGGVLGDVRDLDVLRAYLHEAADDLGDALGPLFASIDERQAQARIVLDVALDGDRYRALLDRLHAAACRPALTEDAAQPCRDVLPILMRKVWNTLKKGGRALEVDSAAEEFHRVRKRAKRARYAAEAVARALGKRPAKAAKRFARAAQRVQDVLGRHQDAVVAREYIERAAAEPAHEGSFCLAAGRLVERQIQVACSARAEFFDVWKRLDRKKLRKWMRA